MTNPTGEQFEISSGEHRAVITEVGAAIRAYEVAGRAVVHGFGADEVISGGKGQNLLPWPNRIRDGRYPWAGKTQQLVLSEPKRHNAIHGLARHVPWILDDRGPDYVTHRIRIYPQPGWPGILAARITHRVSDDGVLVEVEAVNLGYDDLPFGYAAHPYLTVGETTVDDVSLTVPAAQYLTVDDRLLPVALAPVDGTAMDLRAGALLGDLRLDTAVTDLGRDDDGRWRVRLTRGDRHAELWAGPEFAWAQVFTGDDRRDIGIAVEPMTCGPDAFNEGVTHDDMITIAPGAHFSCSWGISGR